MTTSTIRARTALRLCVKAVLNSKSSGRSQGQRPALDSALRGQTTCHNQNCEVGDRERHNREEDPLAGVLHVYPTSELLADMAVNSPACANSHRRRWDFPSHQRITRPVPQPKDCADELTRRAPQLPISSETMHTPTSRSFVNNVSALSSPDQDRHTDARWW